MAAIAATAAPVVMTSESMGPQVALSVIQPETVGIAQDKVRQFGVGDRVHGLAGLQISSAGLFAAFRHRLNAKVVCQSGPAADPDSFDDDVRIHEDDWSGLHTNFLAS